MKNAMQDYIKILDKEGADGIRMNFTEIRPNQLHTLDSKEYAAQYKWDGWFVALVAINGVGTLYSRKNKYREGLDCKGLPDNIYSAELIENTEWSYKFASGKAHGKIIILDMLFKPKGYLEEMVKLGNTILPKGYAVCGYREGNLVDIYKDAIRFGFEGLVLINLKTGERIKVKKVIEGDYVIMGFEISDSATAIKKGGMVRSLMYGDGKRIFGKCSSMPHEMKIDMYRHPKKYIGLTAVISGRERFKSGALRHPAFEGFRDKLDKKI